MNELKGKHTVFSRRVLSLLICIMLVVTGLPLQTKAAVTMRKFIKADSEVFVPASGENTTISFNYQTDHVTNVMVKDGDEIITYLAKEQKFKGSYQVHKLSWDGRDNNGNLVKGGTYTVVVEPQEAVYKKYKSITTVTVLDDNNKNISISPAKKGDTFKIFGKGGSNQGIDKVTLAVFKDGGSSSTINATIDKNLWYADLPMSAYSLYEVKATINGSSGTSTQSISVLRHIFRVSDRLVNLASAYYKDYSMVDEILTDNNLTGKYTNEGVLVNSNLLILNPSSKTQQKVKKETDTTSQRIGIINQIQRTASTNPVSLTMGNNFYINEDIAIDGLIPLTFNRVYNSLSHGLNEFGINWSNSFTYDLKDTGKGVVIQFEDGHMEYYTKESDGSYSTAEGLVRKLTANSDKTYTLLVDGVQSFHFLKDGRLSSIEDLNGNATTLTYSGDLLKRVENISGYLEFTYNTDGTIRNIADNGNRNVSYTYTNGLVTGFANVNGYKTTYFYDSLNRLNKIVSAESITLLSVQYDSSDRVISKTVQGSTYTYDYDDNGRTILCTEPNGNKITFRYTEDYRIESEEYSDGTIKYYYQEKAETEQVVAAIEESNSEQGLLSTSLQKLDKVLLSGDKDSETLSKIIRNSSVSKLSSVNSYQLELQTHNMNTATGSAVNNTLYPQFRIINNGSSTIDLSGITLRYYYTVDGEKQQNFFCDWSMIGAGNVTGKFMKLINPVSTADYYLEVGFLEGAGQLQPGESVETHVRIGKNDWSVFTPGNDYSQNLASGFTSFDKVDMFYNGNLIWGDGSLGEGVEYVPLPGEETENPGGGSPGGEIPSPTPTNPGNNDDNGNKEEEILPFGKNRLKLQMYNTGNSGTTANTIHPMMRLINTGENMVKLSDVTIRYYYTADDEKPQKFWCDWSDAGSQNIIGTFYTLEEPAQDADTYLEIGFQSGSGYIDIGGQLDIHARIAKEDWSDYDITNDYSLRAAEVFEDWEKVDVYVKGVKVWGDGVIPGEEEPAQEEYIEYADTTYTPVRAEMHNVTRQSRSNSISPRFRIYNTSTEAIPLSDINIAYFYTTDGAEEQIFEADWAGIGGRFQSSISREDITVEFTEVGDDNLSTNCAVNIGFTREDIKLAPGEYLEIHVRIHRPSWTNYVQSNDFSINPDATTYEEWDRIAVFVGGKWAYGSLPLTYAAVIEPEPVESQTPIDTKGSYGSHTDKSGNITYYSYDSKGNITSSVDALGNKTEYKYNALNQVTATIDALGNETAYEYDTKGNLTAVTDALGNQTSLTYNTLGAVTRIEYANGGAETRTYDSKGNVKSITDANGNTITLEYDVLNRVTSYTDGNNNMENYEYTADGKISRITDALGYTMQAAYNKDGAITGRTNQKGETTQYQYNTNTGRLSQVIDALSGTEAYQYDNMGNITEITDPNGGITLYEYDLLGRTTAVTDSEGGKTSYKLDTSGNVTEETSALGLVTKYTYDKLNRLTEIIDGKGEKTTYEYDALGRTIKETDALGGAITYKYDKAGNLLQTIDALGNATYQEYNELGLLSASIDGYGNKTVYQYDAGGRQIKQANAAGGTLAWEYDKNNNLMKETDELGNTVTYTYDELNRQIKVTDALGETTEYVYDKVGNRIKEVDALSNPRTYGYNALNQLTQVTDALGNTVKYEYSKTGQLIKETDARGNSIIYEYDKNGNRTKAVDALGHSTTYTYDSLSRLTTEIDARGNTSYYTYDSNDNIISRKDARGYLTTYEYDSLSQLTKVVDALGYTAEYTYDKNGNLTKEKRLGETALDDQTIQYSYDKNGNRTSLTDSLGQKITYEYNDLGQLSKETDKDGNITILKYDKAGNLTKKTYSDNRSKAYEYDKNNRLIKMVDWNGTTQYTYDAIGQVTQVIDYKNQTVSYAWTKTGQKKSITYPDGNQVQYNYDKVGNILKVTDTENGINTYSYDSNNRQLTKKLANGSESIYTYNTVGQIITRVEKAGSTVKASYDYEYDAEGNRIQESKAEGGITQITSYTYDELNQLTHVSDLRGSRTYAYDAFNNRILKEENGEEAIYSVYNRLNQLTEEKQGTETQTYSYDKRGNLITEKLDGVTTIAYTFDAANQLTRVNNVEKNSTTNYQYDGAGNRIQSEITLGTTVTEQKEYVVDTQSAYGDILVSKDTLTGKSSDYTYGNGLISVETNGTMSYYRIDEKLSVEELQSADGETQTIIVYDEFGRVEAPEQIAVNGNIFAYTGHVYEESTGLYYAKARYYDPETARMLSEDTNRGTLSKPLSLNLYTYCWNNPVLYIDYTGNWPEMTEVTRTLARWLIANPVNVNATQEGWFEDLFYLAGFVRDSDGVYHARQDALQQYGGYNKFYDTVFHYATSMKRERFQFRYNDTDYIFWAWKGDYLNLGAGAELGIYKRLVINGTPTDHWLVDTSLALPMTLTLKDNKGNKIFSYSPSEKQWWVTGFNPYYQEVQASDIKATYTIDFSKNKGMYKAFKNSLDPDEIRWRFDIKKYTAIFTF